MFNYYIIPLIKIEPNDKSVLEIISLLAKLRCYDLIFNHFDSIYIYNHINERIYDNNKTDYTTFLIIAILINHIDIVEKCIEYGADINLRDSNGLSALFWAYIINQKIEEYLLSLSSTPSDLEFIEFIESSGELFNIGSIVECKNSNCLDFVKKIGKLISQIDSKDSIFSFEYGDKNRFLNNGALIIINLTLDNKANVALLPEKTIREIFRLSNLILLPLQPLLQSKNNISRINEKMNILNQYSDFKSFLSSLPILYQFDIKDLTLFKPMKITPMTKYNSINTLNSRLENEHQLSTQYSVIAHGSEQLQNSDYCILDPNIFVVMSCTPFLHTTVNQEFLKLGFIDSRDINTFAPSFCNILQKYQPMCIFQNKCPNLKLQFYAKDGEIDIISFIGFGLFSIPITFNNNMTEEELSTLNLRDMSKEDFNQLQEHYTKTNQLSKNFTDEHKLSTVIRHIRFLEDTKNKTTLTEQIELEDLIKLIIENKDNPELLSELQYQKVLLEEKINNILDEMYKSKKFIYFVTSCRN